mgnify:CR=1 FL=1
MDTRFIGSIGEETAEKYLVNKSYKILHKNWTCHAGEIDLIAEKDSKIIFVEVKYVRNNFCKAYELFTFKKLRHLKRSIQQFLLQEGKHTNNWSLDLVTIDKKGNKITHYQDIQSQLLRWY